MSTASDDLALSALAGRTVPDRADSRDTRAKLVAAVPQWVQLHGSPPERLVDVATAAGVSTATAYRHFASVDDAIHAFVLQLPVRAAELFDGAGGACGEPADDLHRWNLAWVRSCLEHGPLAVHLRSAIGFLQRRAAGDPAVGYVCDQIEPLLDRIDGDTTMMLFVWNLTSDPREVLDLTGLGWDTPRIARFVTSAVLATPAT